MGKMEKLSQTGLTNLPLLLHRLSGAAGIQAHIVSALKSVLVPVQCCMWWAFSQWPVGPLWILNIYRQH